MVTQCLSLDLHSALKAEIGSRDVVVVRALASRQCGSGLIPAPCHMRVEAVVCSRFAQRVFSEFLFFFPPQKPCTKTNISKFQFHQDRRLTQQPAKADVSKQKIVISMREFWLRARLQFEKMAGISTL